METETALNFQHVFKRVGGIRTVSTAWLTQVVLSPCIALTTSFYTLYYCDPTLMMLSKEMERELGQLNKVIKESSKGEFCGISIVATCDLLC